ncbi:MAG: aminotransferase class I/II-fold pyridoxal phosphate-dependent enzyme [Candidatus Eisenbacteria bacterium]|uniref:Aminotransferase class I/II-fold pyridoxal phosphate-dependent enzyme n=1 Tax=Eiseniibacteriota bacterium TaxID=2212470 RepID=A0A538SI08_UNCEI|nr:MAG: aminotransferase class I/II-fold pyridoxal phosphate-dependent enzyme [Candidatus Eisenbacteria bacterium]
MPRLIADRPFLKLTSELGQVMAAARVREQTGARVLHLERGEPDFGTPAHIVEALAAAARAGETHYPDARGSLAFRQTLVEKLERENGIRCEPDDVTITQGGTHALFLAFQSLLGPGDELLVLSPHWMAIPKLVSLSHGARYRTMPAYLDAMEGTLAPGALASRLRGALAPETRGIYLNTPNNPTGAVLSREALAEIAAVAVERDLWVVSDEAYEHLLFDGYRHVSVASFPGMAERTVSVFTFSKSYAMTGWRLGYAVSPPALRPVLGPLLSFYTTHGVFPSVQSAGRAAVKGPQDAVETMRRAYQERRDLLLAGLSGQDAVRVPTPRGAFYAFANVEAVRAGRDIWDLVREWLDLGVAVLPGTAFGPENRDWVRMSLATRREDVAEAARILRAHVAAAPRAGVRAG